MQDIEPNVPRGRKSAVRRVRRLAGKRLTFMLGAEDDTLREFAEDSKTGRAAKTLVKDGPLRITLVALKKGTVLPPHHVDGPISIQTIRGCLRLTTESGDMDVSEGNLIALGPGVVTRQRHMRTVRYCLRSRCRKNNSEILERNNRLFVRRDLIQYSVFIEAVEQHMEINKPSIRFPFGGQPAHAIVIEGLPEAEPFL